MLWAVGEATADGRVFGGKSTRPIDEMPGLQKSSAASRLHSGSVDGAIFLLVSCVSNFLRLLNSQFRSAANSSLHSVDADEDYGPYLIDYEVERADATQAVRHVVIEGPGLILI